MTEGEKLHLRTWAKEAVKANLIAREPVCFQERVNTPVQVLDVSRYAADRLWYIRWADAMARTGGLGEYSPEWFEGAIAQEYEALAALRKAMVGSKLDHPALGSVENGEKGDLWLDK